MKVKIVLSALFVALVISANWLASAYIVPVGFGLVAPAGVYAIGGVLVIRDWLQQIMGLWRTMTLVYLAGIISYIVGNLTGWTDLQKIALASIVAFTVSETVEAVVFTPIRKRTLTLGVLLSGFVGNALDSYVFLSLAFGSLAFFWGQFVGKGEAIIVGVFLTALRRFVTDRELAVAHAD